MLVQFSFGNFRSFKETATLSMVAAEGIKVSDELNAANVFAARPQLDLLRVAALYGANASGKSNVVLAIDSFSNAVRHSADFDYRFKLLPFLLDTVSEKEPVFFEVTFIKNQIQYRYGFAVKIAEEESGPHEIQEEWLFQAVKKNEVVLFERDGDFVKRGRRFSEGTALLKEGKLRRKEALFLSSSAQLGEDTALEIVTFIYENVRAVSGLDDEYLRDYTEECLEQKRYHNQIVKLVRDVDTGIVDISTLDEVNLDAELSVMLDGLPRETRDMAREEAARELRVATLHPKFDTEGRQVASVPFPLALLGSEGTKKLFALAGPIFDTLHNGFVLFVDEMNARLHPLLTQAIVNLFQSPETNPQNAQLIFVTHDTNFLNSHKFRRDQIWFVEKDRFGASHLYSLSDFKGIGENDAFAADYFQGRFGGTPFLGGLKNALISNGKA